MTDKPLKGIKVCDYGQHGAGSACGKVLADWGADVIKVEPFWGCPSRYAGVIVGLNTEAGENAHFEMLNSGKRSIAINLKDPEGLEILNRIIAESNIFFSNYRLRALQKFGLDYETLSAKYPALIWGHINGFGTEGPMREEPGFDNASYWAYSGLILDPVNPDAVPKGGVFGGGDVMTGYVLASSMAACLYQQATQGKGQAVYTSLYGVGCWQDSCLIQGAASGRVASGKLGPLDGYKASKDRVWFTLGIMDYKKIGPKLAKLIGHEEYAEVFSSRERLLEQSEHIRKLIDDYFAGLCWDELDARLKGIDIVHCRVQRPAEVAEDRQAKANGYVWDYSLRDGKKAVMVSTPVKFGRQEIIETANAPMIGENTTEVLRELNYSEEEIKSLFEKKAVKEEHYYYSGN